MNTKNPHDRNTKNPLEWVVFAISSLLVLGVIGFLIWNITASDGKPAAFAISIGPTTSTSDSSVIQIKVTNSGSNTAAEVNVAVLARYPSGDRETTLTIDFIPRGGTREGYAVFEGPGKPDAITARVLGYIEP